MAKLASAHVIEHSDLSQAVEYAKSQAWLMDNIRRRLNTKRVRLLKPDGVIDRWAEAHKSLYSALGNRDNIQVKVPDAADEVNILPRLKANKAQAVMAFFEYMRQYEVSISRISCAVKLDAILKIPPRGLMEDKELKWAATGTLGRSGAGKAISQALARVNALYREYAEQPIGANSEEAKTALVKLSEVLRQADAINNQASLYRAETMRNMTVNITFDVVAMEKIGHYVGADDAGKSCFSRDGGNAISPVCLMQTPGSFAGLLQDEGGIVKVRIWGLWVPATSREAQRILIKNIYPKTEGPLRNYADRSFVHAIKEIFKVGEPEGLPGIKQGPELHGDTTILYGDVWGWSWGSPPFDFNTDGLTGNSVVGRCFHCGHEVREAHRYMLVNPGGTEADGIILDQYAPLYAEDFTTHRMVKKEALVQAACGNYFPKDYPTLRTDHAGHRWVEAIVPGWNR